MADVYQKSVISGVEALLSAAKTAGEKGRPPVHLWNPPFCGDMDMRIARDGTWFYLGTPIGRLPLVKLFASIMRRDGEDYFLVTPVEKVGIKVEDAPFVAVDFEVSDPGQNQQFIFRTNVDDYAFAGPQHPIRVTYDETGEPSPYILVRDNLEALIDRKSFYRLIDLCVHRDWQGQQWFGLVSGGQFFAFLRSSELNS